MICFHHNDNDGYCSAAIIAKFYNYNSDIRFIEMSVYDTPDLSIITKNEEIFIVDLSFDNPTFFKMLEITPNITWIDHHETSINNIHFDIISKLKGIHKVGISASKLTWNYFYNDKKIPMIVELVNDYDIWEFKYEQTRNLHSSLISNKETSNPISNLWKCNLNETDDSLKQLLLIGENINSFINNEDFKKSKHLGYIKFFEGYNCLCVNGYLHFNNIVWHDNIKELFDASFDVLIMFNFNGKYWKYSLRSQTIDVSKICKKYNGGGHKYSAGFSSGIFLL